MSGGQAEHCSDRTCAATIRDHNTGTHGGQAEVKIKRKYVQTAMALAHRPGLGGMCWLHQVWSVVFCISSPIFRGNCFISNCSSLKTGNSKPLFIGAELDTPTGQVWAVGQGIKWWECCFGDQAGFSAGSVHS